MSKASCCFADCVRRASCRSGGIHCTGCVLDTREYAAYLSSTCCIVCKRNWQQLSALQRVHACMVRACLALFVASASNGMCFPTSLVADHEQSVATGPKASGGGILRQSLEYRILEAASAWQFVCIYVEKSKSYQQSQNSTGEAAIVREPVAACKAEMRHWQTSSRSIFAEALHSGSSASFVPVRCFWTRSPCTNVGDGPSGRLALLETPF